MRASDDLLFVIARADVLGDLSEAHQAMHTRASTGAPELVENEIVAPSNTASAARLLPDAWARVHDHRLPEKTVEVVST